MKVLLDQNVSAKLAALLENHEVVHARQVGWDQLSNGKLLNAANGDAFDLLITADKQMRFQQNLTGRSVSLAVLDVHPISESNQLACAAALTSLLNTLEPGTIHVIKGPHPKRSNLA